MGEGLDQNHVMTQTWTMKMDAPVHVPLSLPTFALEEITPTLMFVLLVTQIMSQIVIILNV